MFGWFRQKPKIPDNMIQLREPPIGVTGAPIWNEEIQRATDGLGPEFLAPLMIEMSPGMCIGGFVARAKLNTPVRTYEATAVLMQRINDEFRTVVTITAPPVGEDLDAEFLWPPYLMRYDTSLPREQVRDIVNTIRGICAQSHAEASIAREDHRRSLSSIVTTTANVGAQSLEPKSVTQRQGFKANEFVVYPAHGVGQILAIEEQEIAGTKLELFVINFVKDKMTLRVPTAKVPNVGMRKLSDPEVVEAALASLKGRACIEPGLWSDRAQKYEDKINSGDIISIAEVVKDLFRSKTQPELSYSERQLYEAALDRLSREIAVVQHIGEAEATNKVERLLAGR